MAETIEKLGYNEFLDRTIGLAANPIGAEKEVVGIGGTLVGASGSSGLITTPISKGAASAGQVPETNENGVLHDSFQFSSLYTAGEDLSANDAVYVKASDGKLYKAHRSGQETSYNFVGFAKFDVESGDTTTVKTGPIITGFTGLTEGSIYCLAAPGSAGGIETRDDSALGGYGGTHTIPIGMAINTTDLRMFYAGTARAKAGTQTVTVPAVGANTDKTINVGFPNAYWHGHVEMEASDSAGGNTTKRVYHFVGGATTHFYHEVNGAGAVSIGTASTMTVTPNAGTNRSTLTLTEDHDSGSSGPIVRLNNTASAGSGSTNGSVTLHFTVYG